MASGFGNGCSGAAWSANCAVWSANCDQSVIMATSLADSTGGVTSELVSDYLCGYVFKSSGVETAVCEQPVAAHCEPFQAVSPVPLNAVHP